MKSRFIYAKRMVRKVFREGKAYGLKSGEGRVMTLTCMAGSPTINDVTADGSRRLNSEVYRAIVSAHIQPNSAKLIGGHFTVQLHNDPKNSVKARERNVYIGFFFQRPRQSADLVPHCSTQHPFQLHKTN